MSDLTYFDFFSKFNLKTMKKFSLNIQKKFGGMEIKQISWVK
jgi:hypothetical protein